MFRKIDLTRLHYLADKLWYTRFYDLKFILKILYLFLGFLSWVYAVALIARKLFYTKILTPYKAKNIQLWVVGNSTVGGNGKSIFVSWLVDFLTKKDLKVAIISKGYGRKVKVLHEVNCNSTVNQAGDEPLMLYQQTGCHIIVADKRVEAIKYIINLPEKIDVIICDDGKQDYSVYYNRRINVVSANRLVGNGCLLPQGPLREFKSSINEADLAVIMQHSKVDTTLDFPRISIQKHLVKIKLDRIYKLNNYHQQFSLYHGVTVNIVTAIADNSRFIALLRSLGLTINLIKSFPDHHCFVADDFEDFNAKDIIVMTEKDAVKYNADWCKNIWVVAIKAQPENHSLLQVIDDWL